MKFQTIKYDLTDGVARIAFNDPSTLNACGLDTVTEIRAALRNAEENARAIILTGEGRGFCSGANLKANLADTSPTGRSDVGDGLETHYNPLILALTECTIPIVSAVHGPAAGIGCSIALMGDIIIAADNAYFLLAFRNIGLVPDGGATWLLPKLIGRHRAMEMALFGERVPAQKAYEWGLVNRVVSHGDLSAEAHDIAQRLAKGPSIALGLTRQLINSSDDKSFSAALYAERLAQRKAGQTDDNKEGVKAFIEKRAADFKGR